MLCNTVNQEYSEESVGKGDWFPLADPQEEHPFKTEIPGTKHRSCWIPMILRTHTSFGSTKTGMCYLMRNSA